MIFRREALDYRLNTQGQRPATMTWPGPMGRHIRLISWLLIALLGLGGVIACLPAVPVSATGPAIATTRRSRSGALLVAVLMPASDLHRLRVGTTATMDLGPDNVSGSIVTVEPAALTPTQTARRLGLPASALADLAGPVGLVWVTPDSGSIDIAPGAAGQARLQTGTRRAGSFLPLAGRFF